MPKMIQLLLTENVDNLGIVGDVVDVKPGYARNFLLPRGLAMPPSQAAIKRLAARRAEVEKEMARKRAAQQKMIEQLDAFELTMERSANEQGILYGGVSQHEIAEALREQGFEIDDRHVRIGEQIKRLDSYTIPILVAQDLRAEIKLWVVSDKPLETEGDEAPAEASGEAGESAEAPAAEGEAEPAKAEA